MDRHWIEGLRASLRLGRQAQQAVQEDGNYVYKPPRRGLIFCSCVALLGAGLVATGLLFDREPARPRPAYGTPHALLTPPPGVAQNAPIQALQDYQTALHDHIKALEDERQTTADSLQLLNKMVNKAHAELADLKQRRESEEAVLSGLAQQKSQAAASPVPATEPPAAVPAASSPAAPPRTRAEDTAERVSGQKVTRQVVQSGDTPMRLLDRYYGRSDRAARKLFFMLNPSVKDAASLKVGTEVLVPVGPSGDNDAAARRSAHPPRAQLRDASVTETRHASR